MHLRLILTTIILSLTLAYTPQATGEITRPTAHELVAIAAAGGERLWYHEEEFRRDPALRVTPEHVVILHLAQASRNRRIIDHAIPYAFHESATYSFCIPKKDPAVLALELIREGSAKPVVHLQRGGKCKTREIPAGFYSLQVRHDGARIGPEGQNAFIHVPRFRPASASETTLAAAPLGSTSSSFPACNGNNPQFLFAVPSGAFVNIGSDGKMHTVAMVLDTGLFEWSICPTSSGNYTLSRINIFSGPSYFYSAGPPNTDTSIYGNGGSPTEFKLTDLGNSQFSLAAVFNGTPYPIVVGADGVLQWTSSLATPSTVFTIVSRFYNTGITPLLQTGDVALFLSLNYDNSGGTFVFPTNIPDFNALGLSSGFGSVQLGPQTPATLYAGTNYSGTPLFLTGNVPDLGTSAVGYGALSLKVTPDRQYVIATDQCQNCNLSGIDLSNLDLSGGQFQGSTFSGANLTNTILQSANLDNANFTGADTLLTNTNLLGTLIRCTNFSGADLSSATFQFSGVIKPIVTTDFSCRVDLTGATINLTSFPLTQWRYFNLSGATINGVTGAILSTTTSPLDLSGALVNHTKLPQVILDSANLGCASTANGSVCTQLIEASLTAASLKKVKLVNALLQGAHLDNANLDGANLCAAKFNQAPTSNLSATLEGAFLRNVNLSTADLTGASLRNANFYSTSTSGSCTPAACSFTTACASAVGARLNNAVFSGAYLNGVDFSSPATTPQSADFSNASLTGANFDGTNLSQDTTTGKRTDFTGAFLQGTKFTSTTNVTGANFTNAIISAQKQTLLAQLDPKTHIAFPGYTPFVGSTLGCVEFVTGQGTSVPATSSSNVCPDTNVGPCSTAQWQSPKIPPPPLPTNCTTTLTDVNWIIAN